VGVVSDFLVRRRARRWQRWSEVPPEEDYARRARIVTVIATLFFLLVFALIVLGLVLEVS
jgi:hypothetical protein